MPENIFKTLRNETNLSQAQFVKLFGIPLQTYKNWEQGLRTPPDYVYQMMKEIIKYKEITKDEE